MEQSYDALLFGLLLHSMIDLVGIYHDDPASQFTPSASKSLILSAEEKGLRAFQSVPVCPLTLMASLYASSLLACESIGELSMAFERALSLLEIEQCNEHNYGKGVC